MKSTSSLIAVSMAALLLSACATTVPEAAQTTSAASSATGVRYCYKDNLYTAGSDMVCNWADSPTDVCRGLVQNSRIAVTAAQGAPVGSNRCDNGKWLVQLSMK